MARKTYKSKPFLQAGGPALHAGEPAQTSRSLLGLLCQIANRQYQVQQMTVLGAADTYTHDFG